MNKHYELEYVVIDDKQAEEFSYNITADIINKYVLEHKEEFKLWQEQEKLKQIINKVIPINRNFSIEERKKQYKKENIK